MTDTPIYCAWGGEAFVPWKRFAIRCDKEFVVGQSYQMVVQEERSAASHNHYFACIADAWRNLPDKLALEFPTPEHLRKRALIDAGFFEERRLVCSSTAEARKIAAFLSPADDFAVVSISGNVVIERKAKSQSVRAMGKRTFQESKQKVLELLDDMLGVHRGTVDREAGKAA